jgi:hypothetical protein
MLVKFPSESRVEEELRVIENLRRHVSQFGNKAELIRKGVLRGRL